MYDGENSIEKRVDFNIGGEVFNIHLNRWTHNSFKIIEKKWIKYFAQPSETGCKVRIMTYFPDRSFSWRESDLMRSKDFFFSVQSRFPENGMADYLADRSLRISRHLNPEDKYTKRIVSWIKHSGTVEYSLVEHDLYFYDPNTNYALFCIKERNTMSKTFLGVMNGIMFTLSHLLISNKGLLIHGAAVQKDSETVLFLGPSGSGKSTITRLCKPDVCFSDDGVIIKKEKQGVYAYKSPFKLTKWKEKYPDIMKGEIKKIFLLEKGSKNRLVSLKKNELMSTMLKHLIHFYKFLNKETAQMGFYVVKEILDNLPVYRLQFAKKGKIWHTISNSK